MEEQNFKTTLFIVILVAGIWLWQDTKKINSLESQLNEQQSQLDDYQSALDDANSNIDDANSIIEDAQSYAWSSYDDMGWALDNLTTVDNVDNPY
jgi:hypothetical protein